MDQLVGELSSKLKGCRFDSWSGHMTRLWVWSPVRACMRENGLMFLSHTDVSVPDSLPRFLPRSFSLKKCSVDFVLNHYCNVKFL